MASETTRAADIPALLAKTKGAVVAGDITALLKARNTLLWLSTVEETRAQNLAIDAAAAANFELRTVDCDRGICDATGRVLSDAQDPSRALDFIASTRTQALYVLLDWHVWVKDPTVQRKLKNVARTLEGAPRNEARAMLVLTYSADVPPELTGCTIPIDLPLPDRTEIGALLAQACEARPDMAPTNGARDAAIGAALGLTLKGAENCFAKSIANAKSIDPAIVASEKRRIVNGIPGLEWFDVDPRGLAAMGGGDLLKAATKLLARCYSPAARAYGLRAPKGCVVVGPPGTGKSLFAKCVATALGVPLLKGDLNATAGKFVGDSEKGIRRLFATIEAVWRCVLWLDEVEKMLGGAGGPQGADGGVSSDRLGQFLTWMQEKRSEVYVICTANDVSGLPPELLRKGRFDDIWFVDVPTQRERVEVVNAALGEFGRDASTIDASEVARACAGFVGAEIASLVPSAMLVAFADGARPITTADLVEAARNVVPLTKTAGEKIDKLRAWAKGRARPASTPEESTNMGSRLADL
jgi:ATPase family associated with various cellular activities (AAA)/AAA+ lid domain